MVAVGDQVGEGAGGAGGKGREQAWERAGVSGPGSERAREGARGADKRVSGHVGG